MSLYSQYGEDSFIRQNLPLPDKGIFVDVGASDGKTISNTLHFEESGWTGLCIEADPRQQEALKANRKCKLAFCAASNKIPKDGILQYGLKEWGWSGLLRKDGRQIQVDGKTLRAILDENDIQRIDLLSIDTEGTELDVWDSLDVARRPSIVIVEHDTGGMPSQAASLLMRFQADGYDLRHTTKGNFIFTKRA